MAGLIALLVVPVLVAVAALWGAFTLITPKEQEDTGGQAVLRVLGVIALLIVALVGLGIGGCAGFFLFGGGLGNMH